MEKKTEDKASITTTTLTKTTTTTTTTTMTKTTIRKDSPMASEGLDKKAALTRKKNINEYQKKAKLQQEQIASQEKRFCELFPSLPIDKVNDFLKITARFFLLESRIQAVFVNLFMETFYKYKNKMEPTFKRVNGEYLVYVYLAKNKFRSLSSFYEDSFESKDKNNIVDIFLYETKENKTTLSHFVVKNDDFKSILLDCMMLSTPDIRVPFQLPSSLYQACKAFDIDIKKIYCNFGRDLVGNEVPARDLGTLVPYYVHRSVCVSRIEDFNRTMILTSNYASDRDTNTVSESITSEDIIDEKAKEIYESKILLKEGNMIHAKIRERVSNLSYHSYTLSIMCSIWAEQIYNLCATEHKTTQLWIKRKYYISLREYLNNKLDMKDMPTIAHLSFFAILLFLSLDVVTISSNESDRQNEVESSYVIQMREYVKPYEKLYPKTFTFLLKLASDSYRMFDLLKSSHAMVNALNYKQKHKKTVRWGRLIPFNLMKTKGELKKYLEHSFCHLRSASKSSFNMVNLNDSDCVVLIFKRTFVTPLDLKHSMELIVSKSLEPKTGYTVLFDDDHVICVTSSDFLHHILKISTLYFVSKKTLISRNIPLPIFPQLLHNFYYEGKIGMYSTTKIMLSMFHHITYRTGKSNDPRVVKEVFPSIDDELINCFLLLPDIMNIFEDDDEIWWRLTTPYLRLPELSTVNKHELKEACFERYLKNRKSIFTRREEAYLVKGEIDIINDLAYESLYSALKSFVYINLPHSIDQWVCLDLFDIFNKKKELREQFPVLALFLMEFEKTYTYYTVNPQDEPPGWPLRLYIPMRIPGNEEYSPLVLLYELLSYHVLPRPFAFALFFGIHIETKAKRKRNDRVESARNLDIKTINATQAKKLEAKIPAMRKECFMFQHYGLDLMTGVPFEKRREKMTTSNSGEAFRCLLQQLEILSYYRASYVTKREKQIINGLGKEVSDKDNVFCEKGLQSNKYRGLVDKSKFCEFIPLPSSEILFSGTIYPELPLDYLPKTDEPLYFGHCIPSWSCNIVNMKQGYRYIIDMYYSSVSSKRKIEQTRAREKLGPVISVPGVNPITERALYEKKKAEESKKLEEEEEEKEEEEEEESDDEKEFQNYFDDEDGSYRQSNDLDENINDRLSDTCFDFSKQNEVPLFGMSEEMIDLIILYPVCEFECLYDLQQPNKSSGYSSIQETRDFFYTFQREKKDQATSTTITKSLSQTRIEAIAEGFYRIPLNNTEINWSMLENK